MRCCIHKDFGEISRVTVPFGMIDPQGGAA